MIKIIDFVSKYLSIELSFVKQRSVASITAGLQKTVKDLEDHAVEMQAKADATFEAACKGLDDAAKQREEVHAATKTAQNIKGLLA